MASEGFNTWTRLMFMKKYLMKLLKIKGFKLPSVDFIPFMEGWGASSIFLIYDKSLATALFIGADSQC